MHLRSTVLSTAALGVLLGGCQTDGGQVVDDPDPSAAEAGPEEKTDLDGATDGETGAADDGADDPPTDGPTGAELGPAEMCLVDDETCVLGSDPAGTAIVCEAELLSDLGDAPDDFRATIGFGGTPVVEVVLPGSELAGVSAGEPFNATYSMGIPLPAGVFDCLIEPGSTPPRTAELEVEGPTDPLWELRTCDRGDARELAPGVLVCTTTADAFPEETTEIVCSVGFQGPGGTIDIAYGIVPADGAELPPIVAEVDADGLPTAVVNAAVNAAAFGGSPGDPMPVGDHTCSFTYDGATADATFEVG